MAEARAPAPRWFFTREQLENSPSRRCGMEADKELSNRQQAANLIQDMGQRLNVTQLTINTAIVYMHRFYMLHSFTKYHRNIISPTALFLAAKVEEQPRKLEHVIKVSHACLNPPDTQLDTKSDVSASFAKPQPAMVYLQQTQELVVLETILLQTLGFEITIEHPHTDVVKCTQLVRASKDLAQTSYFMATNSLHLTTFCLQYKPTVIACVCIHLACKWSNWEIPVSTDGKHWWEYVDQSVTLELLDELTHEFLQILEKTPSRLKRIRNWRAHQALKKPKSDGQLDNSLINSSMVPNSSILVDPVGSLTTNTSFSKASTSAFPAPVALNSGSMAMQTAHNTEDLAILTSAIPSTSYNMASHHEWPQPQEQTRTEQIYSQKQDPAPVVQYNLNFQQGTTGQMHPGLHQRPDKASVHSLLKSDPIQKVSGKHQGQIYAPAMAVSHKMSLDKYREKRKLETVELDVKEQYIPVHLDPQQHKKRTQSTSSSSRTSPIKMKLPNASGEKIEKHSSEKSVSLKLRIPIPPNERISSKEDLKMKIKVASADRHSSSDEGNGKSKHTSPHVSKEPKEKHKEHSSNRHHSSSHKHSHAHSFGSGSSNNSNKSTTDGMPTTVLRSPMGLPNDNACNSSSSRKRPHAIDASYNHHSKMSKTSKSSGSSSSSSVKQYISSQNTILNYPLPPPPPVTYQVGYGHLSTLVKLDKKPVETNGPDASHEYGANSKHLNYKDTFDMLDSLLSAQGMNM